MTRASTYLRFVLLSILEFWNTVHDFPSIIYHSPESWPWVSLVCGQEERKGSVLFKFHHPTEEKGNQHNSLQKLKLLHRWAAGHSTTDHRSTLILQNIRTSGDLSLAQNKRKMRKTVREQIRALTLRYECDSCGRCAPRVTAPFRSGRYSIPPKISNFPRPVCQGLKTRRVFKYAGAKLRGISARLFALLYSCALWRRFVVESSRNPPPDPALTRACTESDRLRVARAWGVENWKRCTSPLNVQ